MSLKAEIDALKGHKVIQQIYASFGEECKSINIEVDVVSKEVLYILYCDHKEVLKTSDLDIAIQKFNEL